MEDRNIQLEFAQLLSLFSDGRLNDAELVRLGLLMQSDVELRKQYLEYCQMHALLRSEHGLLMSWSPRYTAPNTFSIRSLYDWIHFVGARRFAAAASLLFVATLLLLATYGRSQVPVRGAETAVVSKAVGARFAYGSDGEVKPIAGTTLRAGLYELREGLVEIQYASGAIVVARAPITFELVDRSSIRVIDGQISAHVPQPARGFRIESPGATIIDLGTDFGVEAVKDRDSEVHVFHGDVIVDLHG